MAKKYEFAIKKEILNSGKEILIPVCREKSKIPFFEYRWCRIIELYGVFLLQELEFQPELTYEDCERHISGYITLLENQRANEIIQVKYDPLEVKEI